MKYDSVFRVILFLSILIMGCSRGKSSFLENYKSGCEASQCHEATILGKYPPNSGKHSGHLDKGMICENCHDKYNDNIHHKDSILDTDNNSIIVIFDDSLPESVWDNKDSTCSNLSCHGDVSWYTNEQMTCMFCHTVGTEIDPIPTGSHYRHLNAGYNCIECHENYKNEDTHINGINNNAETAPGMLNFSASHNPDGIYNSSTSTCSNLYCHGKFPIVNYDSANINPGNNYSPTWGYPATAACGTCHGNTDNNFSSVTHGSHTDNNHVPGIFNNTSKIESCDACHNYGNDIVRSFGSDSTQGSYNTEFHANFSIDNNGINSDVNFKENNSDLTSKTSPNTIVTAHTTWNAESTTCSNSWCHGNFRDGSDITGNNSTPNWLDPSTVQCGTCHNDDIHDFSNQCGRCHEGGAGGPVPSHINGTIYTP